MNEDVKVFYLTFQLVTNDHVNNLIPVLKCSTKSCDLDPIPTNVKNVHVLCFDTVFY